MGKILRYSNIMQSREVLTYCFAFVCSLILKQLPSNKNIWLISERKNECKDNGYHLFNYIREKYPKHKVYYVIENTATELEKIQQLGNIIYYKSIKHYIYYFLAARLIGAHLACSVPDSAICWKMENLGVIKKKKVYISHGITKEMLPMHKYQNTNISMYVSGGKPEFDFIEKSFEYPAGYVKYIGFCRFDSLYECNTKKQILVMPTWRQWLHTISNTWGIATNTNIFTDSQYYQEFQEFINDSRLDLLLKQYDFTLIFFPHHEMQDCLELFSTKSSNIIIAKEEDYDVQQLLKESAILLTDYSSVAFDFAYMYKPVIYYQFDTARYYKEHYEKGYYDFVDHGFGPVLSSCSDVIKELQKLLHHNENEMLPLYKKRVEDFFVLHDQQNCARTYEAIRELE